MPSPAADLREARLAEVAEIAWRTEQQTGLPARMCVAQWAAESRWGAEPVGKFNFFGIKAAARHNIVAVVTTHEWINGRRVQRVERFADYESLGDACWDYAWLITTGAPYRTAWQRFLRDRKVEDLITGVAAKYATDPGYGKLLLKIAFQPNVSRAIQKARAK